MRRKRKRQPPRIIATRTVVRNGMKFDVFVYEDSPVRTAPQPLRGKAYKMKRTSKVYDPHVSQRPVTVQPARGQ
jgi:hypothetical protein